VSGRPATGLAAAATCALALLAGCRSARSRSPSAAAGGPGTGRRAGARWRLRGGISPRRARRSPSASALRAAEERQAELRRGCSSSRPRQGAAASARRRSRPNSTTRSSSRPRQGKLRSLESRAEAAVDDGRGGGASRRSPRRCRGGARALDKAEALLRMSADEFEKENYGGALFLAGQAKVTCGRPSRGRATSSCCPRGRAGGAARAAGDDRGEPARRPGQEFRVLTALAARHRSDRGLPQGPLGAVRDAHARSGLGVRGAGASGPAADHSPERMTRRALPVGR